MSVSRSSVPSHSHEITAMTYDSSGRLNSYTEEGMLYTYTYFFTSPSKRDALGNEWSFFYGAGGVVTKRVLPGGGEHRNDIDAEGRTIFFADEVGDRTQTWYLSDGRVAVIQMGTGANPRIQHLYYTYDATFPDKVAAITPMNFDATAPDRNWQEWKYDYYAPGSPAPGALHHIYRVLTDGTQQTMATYVYDSRGRVTSTTDAAGAVTDSVYDAAGNLQGVTSPSNNDAGIRPVTSYAYDALGRVTSVTDPLGKATSYTYDALDRITSVTLPRPSPGSPLNFVTTHLYDQYEAGTGLVWTQTTDPNGKITRQGHDPFGRLVRSTDALSATTLYTYDRHVLRSITDANGNVTSYEYDALQRLTATVFPDGARETYTYFLDGQLKTKTDRKNQTVTYAYDSLKRLTSKTYPNLTSITYTYAGQNLTQVSDTSTTPGETHTFSWDPAYRVSSNTQGPRGTLSYTYTAGDAVASYTVQGGPTASYTYYPDGSLNTIQWSPVTGQFKYAYTRNGQYQTITLPNGQTRNYSYDDQGRLVTLGNVHPSAGNLATYDYAYDLNHLTGQNTMLGQRVSLTATVPSQGLSAALTKYSYDGGYQLTRAEYPAPAPFNGEVHSWTYDAIGNRLTSTVNAATANYSYQKIGTNPNNWQRLLSDGVSGYTYDANGNAATKTGLTFGWDAENRLTSIGGTTTASYGYDYQGRRSAKTSGTTTSYLYDGLNLLRETPASPVDYLFGPGIDEPIAVSEGGAVHYPLVDGLGSVAGLASSVGVVANQYSYDAWGVTKSQSGTVSNAFGYTSREFGEGGLSFYRARFYNPSSGRFLSEDPIKSMSFSAYAYVGNRPTWFTDPSGKIRAKIPIRYRGVRYDQMKDLCGEPARGCAGFVSLEARCSCRCVGDQWVPMPWIAVAEIRIYVAMDCDDVGSTFKEEFRHAAVKQRDLEKENRRALDFRKESFGSKAACEFRCMRWEASTIANLANFWEHMFIDATHFLSGSSKCIR